LADDAARNHRHTWGPGGIAARPRICRNAICRFHTAMPRLDAATLKNATVYIGEKKYYERQQLRDLFLAQGLKQIVCHSNISSLRDVMAEVPPDLLILGDDFDPGIFDLVKEIRFQKLGENPFMLISMLVSPAHRDALERAIEAGVDDIIIKPVSPERIQERLKLVTFHRRPFIATDGYVGPERKTEAPTGARVRRFPVINTLLEKVHGRDMDKFALKAAVEGSLQQVLQAQLDSQSFRLGEVCERLVNAYDTGSITDNVQSDLLMLADVLKDAGNVATRLKDEQLSALCISLAENVIQIADHYTDPSSLEIDLIRKLTMAFKMAMKAPEENPDAMELPRASNG
jgi:DNA-binding response OmpR family regulator